mgnify:CR=1 FL=1
MYYFLSVTPNYPNSYWLEYYRASSIESVVFLREQKKYQSQRILLFSILTKI